MALSFLCDLSGLGVRGFFPHAEDAKGAKAQAQELSAAQPQPNGVRPSSGAETSDGHTCGSNPEPQTSLKLLRPGTAALRKFIATCEQFPRLQSSGRASRRCEFVGAGPRFLS